MEFAATVAWSTNSEMKSCQAINHDYLMTADLQFSGEHLATETIKYLFAIHDFAFARAMPMHCISIFGSMESIY